MGLIAFTVDKCTHGQLDDLRVKSALNRPFPGTKQKLCVLLCRFNTMMNSLAVYFLPHHTLRSKINPQLHGVIFRHTGAQPLACTRKLIICDGLTDSLIKGSTRQNAKKKGALKKTETLSAGFKRQFKSKAPQMRRSHRDCKLCCHRESVVLIEKHYVAAPLTPFLLVQ